LRFVPGGPDPITNGFGNFSPSTVVASVGIEAPSFVEPDVLRSSAAEFDRIFSDIISPIATAGKRIPFCRFFSISLSYKVKSEMWHSDRNSSFT